VLTRDGWYGAGCTDRCVWMYGYTANIYYVIEFILYERESGSGSDQIGPDQIRSGQVRSAGYIRYILYRMSVPICMYSQWGSEIAEHGDRSTGSSVDEQRRWLTEYITCGCVTYLPILYPKIQRQHQRQGLRASWLAWIAG